MVSFNEAMDFNYTLELPVLKTLKKNIYEACGEILASDIFCSKPLPAFDNSAMDGYALKISDSGRKLKIASKILAGQRIDGLEVLKGECIKVMTGAILPKGTEVIVPIEEVKILDDEYLITPMNIKKGQHIRLKGEDKTLGSVIAKRGDVLTYGLIALIASQGIDSVEVYDRLKIGVYSGGDEVIEPGMAAGEHQIYNANAAGIVALLCSYGHKVKYLGILEDDYDEQCKAIASFDSYDIIITSGGVSVGDADFIKKSLLDCGANIIYHGIKLKPGKPMMLATLKQCKIFGLPGNPLSALLNLNMIVIPALQYLRGAKAFYPKPLLATLRDTLMLKDGRVNMILGRFENDEFIPYNNGKYGSAALNVIVDCNSVALVGEDKNNISGKIKILPYVMEFSDTINEFINT